LLNREQGRFVIRNAEKICELILLIPILLLLLQKKHYYYGTGGTHHRPHAESALAKQE